MPGLGARREGWVRCIFPGSIRYSGRTDAGSLYELTVRLLSEHEDVLAEFNTGQVAVPEDGGWMEVSHTFTDYGPGVRFVRFEHGGQDSVYWKGWFGARVTNTPASPTPPRPFLQPGPRGDRRICCLTGGWLPFASPRQSLLECTFRGGMGLLHT
ncbi:F-box only protein 2 [Cricetulus griseus]|uniref:F-box only protein 2 n=1 Tax=Cricetulus griseus TaxID=10029 RepID=A0A061II63_CRIGR|nr:F-box only protein 2 [Cricetulus griseus]